MSDILSSAANTASSPVAAASFMDRARQLIQRGRLAAVPLAVAAVAAAAAPEANAQMAVDYAGVTTYSNSGWFTGVFISEEAAGGSVTGNTANLTGNTGLIPANKLPDNYLVPGVTGLTDRLFWRYDSYDEKTVPRGDTTGVAFFWGGTLTDRTALNGDKLSAAVSFTVDFEHTPTGEYDSPNVAYELMIGYGSTPYEIDYGYIQSPRNGSSNYNNTSGSFYGAEAISPLTISQNLDLWMSEGAEPTYWFAQLVINWNHEYANSWYWDDDYSKLNYDQLAAFGSMDVTLHQVPPAPIPEPADVALGMGAVAVLALTVRRRWTARA